MPLEDKRTRRLVEREISKHAVDASLLAITVINKVATFKGRIKRLHGPAGRGVDLKTELSNIESAIILINGVNEVVFDVALDR